MSPLPISLFALLTLSACTQATSNDPPPGAEGGGEHAAGSKPRIKSRPLPPEEQVRVGPGLEEASCDAEPAKRFVGQKADEATVKAAVAASGAKTARVIEPDMMVTMDYRGDRVNIRVDDAGKIIAIDCS